MAGETVIGYMTYKLGLDSTNLKRGVQTAKQDIKELERSADTSDIKMKKLAGDVSVLGGSLATMGGLAMGAGLALGDSGMGNALTTAGMGMSILGGTLATVVPAMKGMAVVIQGQLIPALVAANAFLGPTGWLVIGLGVAAAAIAAFVYTQKGAHDSLSTTAQSAEEAKRQIEGLNDALREKVRLEQEMAGLPTKKEELEFELTGAKLAEKSSYERLQRAASEGVTGTELEQAGYAYLSDQRRRQKIEAAISGLGAVEPALMSATTEATKWQVAANTGSTYEQVSQYQLQAGAGIVPARLEGAQGVTISIGEFIVNNGQTVKEAMSDLMSLGRGYSQKGMI